MVVTAKVAAIHREMMDHSGLAIGGIERFRIGIVSERAERCAGIGPATKGHIGEQAHFAGCALDFPDRSRSALRTPQAGHEHSLRRARLDVFRLAVRPWCYDRQSVDGACRYV